MRKEKKIQVGGFAEVFYDCHHDDKYFCPQFKLFREAFDKQNSPYHNCLQNHRFNAL